MITHRNAAMNTIGTLLHLRLGVGDRYLWTLPMFHANGWTFTWTVTAVGGTHVCLRKVDPALVFSLIRDERVGWLCAAPTVLISLANAPASATGRGAGRGAGRSPRARRRPRPPSSGSRASSAGTSPTCTGSPRPRRSSPCATPLPEHAGLSPADRAVLKARQGVELITSGELRVVDDAGAEVPADGVTLGEITVRGNVVMDGYYNDPEATKKAMGDGWFHSGDAAVVHPDGYVEIRDRIKDVIISGGENISSVEVEGTLLRHPAVGEAAVVGLPSERWGETPHAFVVLLAGAGGDRGGADRVRADEARALQGTARRHLRGRAAQDRDRQDPEVRAARRRRQHFPPVAQRLAAGCPAATRCSLSLPSVTAMTDSIQAETAGKPGFTRRRFIIGSAGVSAVAALGGTTVRAPRAFAATAPSGPPTTTLPLPITTGPEQLLLTWGGNPATEVTVSWSAPGTVAQPAPVLAFSTRPISAANPGWTVKLPDPAAA